MKGNHHLLVVDDDNIIVKTLVDIFNHKGYQAVAANSAREALEDLERERFELLLSDIRLPDMNGVQLIQSGKIIQPDIMVILMTAYAADELVQEGIRAGANKVFVKPLDVGNLLDYISSLLDG